MYFNDILYHSLEDDLTSKHYPVAIGSHRQTESVTLLKYNEIAYVQWWCRIAIWSFRGDSTAGTKLYHNINAYILKKRLLRVLCGMPGFFWGGSQFLGRVLWTPKGSSGLTRSKWVQNGFFVRTFLLQGFFQPLSKNKTIKCFKYYNISNISLTAIASQDNILDRYILPGFLGKVFY